MQVAKEKMVTLTYSLTLPAKGGEVIDSANKENPLTFMAGIGMMIPGFDAGIEGKSAGDNYVLDIPAAEAYGEVEEDAVVDLPKNIFEVEGKVDEDVIKVGNTVPMMAANGQRMNGIVLEVSEDTVKMDFNHPLAGQALHFEGEIVEVRDATEEEKQQILNPTGGCGCGEQDSCDSDCGDGGCSC